MLQLQIMMIQRTLTNRYNEEEEAGIEIRNKGSTIVGG
jgi:hypothetical protein